ncbi:hypothetical protein ACFWA2_19815 [Bacillus subtilis]|uniref:hypothetical protein n=1 Tax=Bacillus subtilis TaxID=1423 RepID=UPI0013D749F8|nr:hypothetical protein [Bacillus subtilis]MDP8527361.1 hypothetical protein [Bacillus subtilis]
MKKFQRDQKFIHKENWSYIKRGWMHEAVVPFTAERPLNFFHEDPTDSSKGVIAKGLGSFTPGKIHKAVIELKQRKVVILSNDDHCSDTDIYDVTVAPVYGIYEDDKKENWYSLAVKDQHPFFAYLPKDITGKECVVDLTNVISISKNMLLVDKVDINHKMSHIESLLEKCLSLGIYRKSSIDTSEEGAS